MKQRRADLIILLVYAVLVLVLFHDVLGPGKMLFAYDQTGGSLQWREFMVSAVKTFGAFPFWDPYMFGGMPFIGVLHGDILYPTSLFRMFLPAYLVMNWVFIVHGFITAALAFFFAKNRLRLSREVSFLVGLSYAFTAGMVSLAFAGHDGKFIVASLLPGVIYALDAGMEKGHLRYFALGGLLLGLDFLSPHAQLAYYTYLAAGVWFVFALVWRWRDGMRWPGLLKRVGYFAIMALLGVGVSAAQFVPAFYYAQHFSPRTAKGYEYAVSWSMPWMDLVGAFFPKFGGYLDSYWGSNPFKHNSEYLGAFAGLFSVVALWLSGKKRNTVAALTLALLFTVIALGGHTPLYKAFYYLLPGIKKFRAPGMGFILSAFFLNVLAGLGLEALRERAARVSRLQKKALIGIGIVLGLGIIAFAMGDGFRGFLASLFSVQDKTKLAALAGNYSMIPNGILRVGVLMALLWFAAGAWARKGFKGLWFAALAGALVFGDLWSVGKDFLKTLPEPSVYYAKDEVIRFLDGDRDVFRVMPMFWRMSDNYLMEHGYENIGGHHGQQIRRYMELLEDSLGTIMFNPLACPNLLNYPDIADILNTKYVVSQPLPRDLSVVSPDQAQLLRPVLSFLSPLHFELVKATSEVQIYRNKRYLPRAFIVDSFVVAPGDRGVLDAMKRVDLHRVAVFPAEEAPKVVLSPGKRWSTRVVNYEPNRVVLDASVDGTGILIYSGNWYPFWRARVDGKDAKPLRVDYTLMGLVLGSGQHRVELWYEPVLERWGAAASALALLFVAGCLVFPVRRRKRIDREDKKDS